MENSHHQNCPFCKLVVERPKYVIEENKSYLSLANISPDSKGHVLIITKEPRTNITELTKEEWNNLFPILKSTTIRIINTLHPRGFIIYSNTGVKGAARQAVRHFHLHIVPEGKEEWGSRYLRKPWFIPSVEKYQEIEESLQTNQGIIEESDKVVAKLIERKQSSDYGHIIVAIKKTSVNDLNQTDAETWSQMGKLLQESIKRVKQNLNPGSLRMCIFLGTIGGLKDNSQLQIHLIPRYESQSYEAEVIPIPSEVLEVAERLRKAESEILLKTAEEKSEDDKPTGSENPLPLDGEVKKASEEELINLKKLIEVELANREKQSQNTIFS